MADKDLKSYDYRTLKAKVSITLDQDVVDGIKELAEADDRSFSQYINFILKKHIKELYGKRKA